MKVYVVTNEPYHDNSCIMGAYATLEAAERSVPGATFVREGCYVIGREDVVSQSCDGGADYLVHEMEVQ